MFVLLRQSVFYSLPDFNFRHLPEIKSGFAQMTGSGWRTMGSLRTADSLSAAFSLKVSKAERKRHNSKTLIGRVRKLMLLEKQKQLNAKEFAC